MHEHIRLQTGPKSWGKINDRPRSGFRKLWKSDQHLTRYHALCEKFRSTTSGTPVTALETLYRWLPDAFFDRFYTDHTLLIDHGLLHAFDVLQIAWDILQVEPKLANEMDLPALVYGALYHDLSSICGRYEHDRVSANWAHTILTAERNHNSDFPFSDEQVDKICSTIRGHKKITQPGILRPDHIAHPEARLVHDADAISAADPHRIYRTWLAWSIEETNAAYTVWDYVKPLTENKFYVSQPLKQRTDVVRFNLGFSESDGVTDLYVKVVWRTSPAYCGSYFLVPASVEYMTGLQRRQPRDMDYLSGYVNEHKQGIRADYGLEVSVISRILNWTAPLWAMLARLTYCVPWGSVESVSWDCGTREKRRSSAL